ncbi:hypothetical protein DYH09_11645 [bacterium CPR1]|nr:hypothetical protein [bacterium CPR1]
MAVSDVTATQATPAPPRTPIPTDPGSKPPASPEAGPANLTRVEQLRQTSPGPANPGQAQPVLDKQANLAAGARGEVLTDPARILEYERSRPGVREAYAKLTPQQRQQFDGMVRSQLAPGTELNTAPGGYGMGGMFSGMMGATPAQKPDAKQQAIIDGNGARSGLYLALSNGRLLQTDAQGKTTLENLNTLKNQRFAPGVDGKAIFSQTASVVGGLGSVPSDQGTNASAALLREMANSKPAEFVRQVSGLAGPSGEARVGESSVKRDPSATGSVSDLYQASTAGVARAELRRSELSRNPKAQATYQSLPPDQRGKVDLLIEASIPAGQPVKVPTNFDPHAPESKAYFEQMQASMRADGSRQGIYSLLADGRVYNRDSKGVTLIDRLDQMRTQPMASGLNRDQILAETISQSAHPDRIQQGNRGTCTVTTLEHLNAKREPAEYVRLVSGLTGPEGKVVLRNGDTLNRDEGVLQNDNSGRTSVSRIYQASLMEYGNGAAWNYDNARDTHIDRNGVATKRKGKETSGLYGEQWQRALQGVLPGSVHFTPANPDSPQVSMADIQGGLSQGREVPVALRWGKDKDGDYGSHALSVSRMDDKYVYLRNPHGFGEMGNTDPNNGPIREALRPAMPTSGGFGVGFGGAVGAPNCLPANGPNPNVPEGNAGDTRMTREEFLKNLQFYYKFSR